MLEHRASGWSIGYFFCVFVFIVDEQHSREKEEEEEEEAYYHKGKEEEYHKRNMCALHETRTAKIGLSDGFCIKDELLLPLPLPLPLHAE